MKVHDAIALALHRRGIDALFGVQGDANMHIIDHLVHRYDVRYVKAAREDGAVSMADGYAQVRGTIGVATVSKGPALTNTVTALTTSARNRTAIVVVVGDSRADGSGTLQEIDQRDVVHATGVGFHRVTAAHTAADDVAFAFRRAALESRPIVLDVPLDIQLQDVDETPPKTEAPQPAAPVPDMDDLDRAVGILASARRPLVLAGRGAVYSGARELLIRLARELGAPLATTLAAKDLFRGEPFNLGIFGTLSTAQSQRVFEEADCVVAFGASLNSKTTANGTMLRGKKLVHVDLAPARFGVDVAVDSTVVGDVAAACTTMLDWLGELSHSPSSFCSGELASELAARSLLDDIVDSSGPATVDARLATVRLDEILPADRTLVTDTGRFMNGAVVGLHVPGPEAFASSAGFAAVGMGLGTAIGAAVAHPERPTVLAVGDGGLMMSVQEIGTAVRYGLDLIIVAYNNKAYGAEVDNAVTHGLSLEEALIDWPDLAPLAAAFGATGVTVTSLDELEQIEKVVGTRDGPVLIDLRLDPLAPSGF